MPSAPSPSVPDFWSFSLDFYGRPGVAETCLDLQDRHGLSYLFVSHDLSVVKHISNRIAVSDTATEPPASPCNSSGST